MVVEKVIARWSYWLGIACLVVTVIWKALNTFGLWLPSGVTPGGGITYLSFFHASILFFVTTVATACHSWLIQSQKP
jgi:hypothetical protein